MAFLACLRLGFTASPKTILLIGSIAQGLLSGLLCFVFFSEGILVCGFLALGSLLAYAYLLFETIRRKESWNLFSCILNALGAALLTGAILLISLETGFEPVIILLLSGPAILLALYHFLIRRRRAAMASE